MPRLLLVLLILAGVTACKKGKDPSPLIGKWKQTEYFDVASATPCHCWKPVVEMGSNLIEFNVNGTYKLTPPVYTSALYCPNKFTINNDNTLSITWGCQTGYDTTMIHKYEWEGNQLIIHWPSGPADYKLKFKRVGP